MSRFQSILLLLAFFSSTAFNQANFSWQEKIDPVLLQKLEQRQESVPMLVVFAEQAAISTSNSNLSKEEKGRLVFDALQRSAQQHQAATKSWLLSQNIPFHAFYIVNAIALEGDLDLAQALAARPEIAEIIDAAPYVVETTMDEKGSPFVADVLEGGLDMINADDVWAMGFRGQGVVVGGQDTGYDWNHPALKPKYRGFDVSTGAVDHNYNWHDAIREINPMNNDSIITPTTNPCGLNAAAPCDDNSHGTHTMGTMVGGEGDNQIGVAPDAKWIGCRNMERGYGSPSTYIECFEWFLAPTDLNNENPDPSKAPHVFANSWSCPEEEGCNPSNFGLMELAVNNLKAAGIVVVVSAGNSGGQGCGSVSTPAAIFENSFTVGAVRQADTLANFSSRGPVLVDGSLRMKPNVSAPGVGVRSSVLNGEYGVKGGTSMAGPHVAGLVALLISAKPELAGQVDLIEDLIEQSAIPKMYDQECGGVPGTSVPNNGHGWGRVDALRAVNRALGITNITTVVPFTGSITPNPGSDMCTITWDAAALELASIQIYNTLGILIVKHQVSQLSSLQESTQTWPKGMYIITGTLNNGQRWSETWLKQ